MNFSAKSRTNGIKINANMEAGLPHIVEFAI